MTDKNYPGVFQNVKPNRNFLLTVKLFFDNMS